MLNTILVPLDGSDLSARILDRLEPVFQHATPQVHLLRAVPEASLEASARAQLEEFASSLSARRATFTTQVEVGDPAHAILSYVDKNRPELVAMSTHGASGLTRWVRGSVAERVLRRCPSPLLLANPAALDADSGPDFRRILVPLDGSKTAAEVLPLVEEFARPASAEVLLLCVAAPQVMVAPMGTPTQPDPGRRAAELLEPYQTMLTTAGIEVRTRTALGPPAEWILKVAEEEAVDLLAMTTHGRSGVERWLFGSVAEKVLRASPCPVALHRSFTQS